MAEMTREEVLAIKALADRAATAPWRVVDQNEGDPPEYGAFWTVCSQDGLDDSDWFAELRVGHKDDAKFIAASRSAVPALCDEVLRLMDENARLRAELEAAKRDIRHVLRADFTYDVCGICDQYQARGDCWDCENANWRGLCAENGGEGK